MLCEIKDGCERMVVKGDFTRVFLEVTQGGHGVEGDPYQRLTNLIITPVKRRVDGSGWEKAASVFLRLDEDAAEFLAQALKRVLSGQEMVLGHTIRGEPEGSAATQPKSP